MDVLRLIQCKNRCLSQFGALSRHFLPQFQSLNFDGLENFQTQRGSILKALDLFDRKLNETLQQLRPHQKSPELLAAAKKLLEDQDGLLKDIIAIEQQIMSLIENETSRINLELNQTQKSKDTVQKFKSSWVSEGGEGLDTKL